jgi:hypothetical protein
VWWMHQKRNLTRWLKADLDDLGAT